MQFPLPPFDGKTKAECNYYSWTATGSGYQSESDNDARRRKEKRKESRCMTLYSVPFFWLFLVASLTRLPRMCKANMQCIGRAVTGNPFPAGLLDIQGVLA